MDDVLCPCRRDKRYSLCCEPTHQGEKAAVSAEALMRSRYSAYVFGLTDYLLATWHTSTRPASLVLNPKTQWLGLEVRRADTRGEEALVEFVARSKTNGKALRMHETSRFVFEGRRWFYVDGVHHEPPA
jgi:SEC-C motif domain protein